MALTTMVENVVESIETRIVRKSVLPRKAKATIRIGPSSQWNSTDVVIPVPSRPNQIHNIHLEIVTGPCWPSPSQNIERKKPAKHQTARMVRTVKSRIIARKETNSMFSDIRLNARRGTRTGAPMASTSIACWEVVRESWRRPCSLRIRYTPNVKEKVTSRNDQRF